MLQLDVPLSFLLTLKDVCSVSRTTITVNSTSRRWKVSSGVDLNRIPRLLGEFRVAF